MKLFLIESNIEGLFNYYWSSTPFLGLAEFAYYIAFDPYGACPYYGYGRYGGFPIRHLNL